MLDLNSGSGLQIRPPDLSDKINDAINAGLIERRKREPKRTYLGASRLGEPCARKLCYEYAGTPPDPGRELTGLNLRIFDAGHALEDYAAEQFDAPDKPVWDALAIRWFKDAGFDLVTRDQRDTTKQIGFSVLDGKMRGHTDGVFVKSPIPEILTPCGWEHKGIKAKNWNKFRKHGVKVASGVYFDQIQCYMAYLDLPRYLFTVTNKDTCEMYHELIEFDAARAQRISDRGLEVIRAVEGGYLLDRVANNKDFYLCKFCDWRQRCWS